MPHFRALRYSSRFRAFVLILLTAAAPFVAGDARAQSGPPAPNPKIVDLTNEHGTIHGEGLTVGLNQDLYVVLEPKQYFNPTGYALYLNGLEIKGLTPRYVVHRNALAFRLERTDMNKEAWKPLLGVPQSSTLLVHAAVGPAGGKSAAFDADPADPKFQLILFHRTTLFVSIFFVFTIAAALVLWAKKTALLRDNVMPAIKPAERTFSMGRNQMAFWFVLILGSYLFILAITWDYNSLSAQSLALVGIAAATALGAVAIDVSKDNPALKSARAALAALNLNSAEDVAQLEKDLARRPGDQTLKDRMAAYRAAIAPYTSRGWWRDLINEDDSPTIHRFQMLAWTLVLGVIFIVGVYQSLAMPNFSETLLALMGISGGTYLGFKLPEKQ